MGREKKGNIKIKQVGSRIELDVVRELFKEYASTLNFDLSFQNFKKELAGLPGEYNKPAGRLLIAIHNAQIVGCVALRKIDRFTCEMKRLYVHPKYRGRGIGRKLAQAIVKRARRLGYRSMRLDTISSMHEAIALYKSMGFKKIPAYRYNPITGATFMELSLK